MTLLDVRNLRTYLNVGKGVVQAVEGVNLKIDEGETFCLVGESGSGKSITALSIMRLFADGLATHPSGEIWFAGTGIEEKRIITPEIELAEKRRSYAHRAVFNPADADRHTYTPTEGSINLLKLGEDSMQQVRGSQIAMIFQEPMTSLNPVFMIGDQIVEALLLHNPTMTEAEAEERTIKALEQVQLPDVRERMRSFPHQLSGGQRQRVMIAMALACEPRLLIADEPTTALDVTVQAEILRLMHQLQDDTGMSMLFITHDFGVVSQMAHHVGVMQEGRLVESGEAKQVLRQPKHTYTKQLLAAVPENLARKREKPIEEKPKDQTLLSVKDLKVWFPIRKGLMRRVVDHVRAVDGVDLSIPKGKIVTLVGESGCGKTTLGRSILQLERPTSGSVNIDGNDLTQLSMRDLRPWRSKLQIAFQDPQSSLNPRLLVETTLTEPMKAHGIGNSPEERLELAARTLEKVQLKRDFLWRYPHEFSGGQRQRIGLARALVLNPSFIVCDEITSALDVSVQAEILELLLDIRQQQDLTLLFITHNIAVVEYLSDQTVVMYKGKIVEQGETAQVCGNPQHEYTQKLLSAVPRLQVA